MQVKVYIPTSAGLEFGEWRSLLLLFYRLHGGGYWQWNDVNKRWVPGTGYGYADEPRRIEALVAAGTPPADWS